MKRSTVLATFGVMLAFNAGCPFPWQPDDGGSGQDPPAQNANNANNGAPNENANNGNSNHGTDNGNANNGDGADEPNNGNENGAPPDNGNDNGAPTPEPAPTLIGVWQAQTPSPLSAFGFEPVEFIEFAADGRAGAHRRDARTEFVSCVTSSFIDLGEALISTVEGEGGFAALTLYEFIDDDTLRLIDDFAGEQTFRRTSAVPEELQCGQLEIVREFRDLKRPNFATGLALDGDLIWYTDDDRISHAFNLTTGAFAATITFTQAPLVHALAGADFWLTCACGGDFVQKRSAANALLDEIRVDADFGVEPDALAFDSQSGNLWVTGFSDAEEISKLLRFDVAADPNVLLAEVAVRSADALAFDGGRMWALERRGFLFEIDLATGKSLQTFELPRGAFEIEAIAVRGAQVFLLAEDFSTFDGPATGMIIEARFGN